MDSKHCSSLPLQLLQPLLLPKRVLDLPSAGNMLEIRRGGDHLRKRWKTNREARNCAAKTPELLISGNLHQDRSIEEQTDNFSDSGQDVLSELSEEVASDLSKSAVSLVLPDEHSVLFACSCIFIGRHQFFESFLTSPRLVSLFNEKRKGNDTLEIEVRHEDYFAKGYLEEYSLDQAFAVVNIAIPFDLRAVDLNHQNSSARGLAAARRFASRCCLNYCSGKDCPLRALVHSDILTVKTTKKN